MIYYIPDVTHSTDDPKEGLVWLVQQEQDAKKVVIFSNEEVIKTVFKSLGFVDDVINGIIKGKRIAVSQDLAVPVATLSDGIPADFEYALLFYPSRDVLDTLSNVKGVKDILVIPWAEDDIQYLQSVGQVFKGSF